MELRKDPITRSWVVVGAPETEGEKPEACPLCPGNEGETRTLLALPSAGPWQVRVFPHFHPLYRIEGETGRSAEGMYDRMNLVGAHEIIVETPQHDAVFSHLGNDEILRVLEAYGQRISDLKGDRRFKYVTVFKNAGPHAGQEWSHPHSQLTATTFVPRRCLYELRAAKEWHREKERCVFCDIIRQEEKQKKRVVDTQGDYIAFCPYASRVPFETWIVSRRHNHRFESPLPGSNRRHLAALLGRTLRRLLKLSGNYHLVVHTAPNTLQGKSSLGEYWKTLADDYHWHIEVMPILPARAKSYSLKEVYINGLLPEKAAEMLRQSDPER
ncbi:MAG: galactose-1-phosphate uridylyltransferase [Candidatus Acidiferrales bacterium]